MVTSELTELKLSKLQQNAMAIPLPTPHGILKVYGG